MNKSPEGNEVAKAIVDAAFHVHVDLGPGLLESAYETILASRLQRLGFKVDRQRPITLRIDGITVDDGFRADLVVNDLVIVELKSVVSMSAVFDKQLRTYLKLSGIRIGLLINFGSELFKEGVSRVVVGKPQPGDFGDRNPKQPQPIAGPASTVNASGRFRTKQGGALVASTKPVG